MKSILRHLVVIALCCTVQHTVAGNELPNVANSAASTSVAGLLDDVKKARATIAATDSRCGNVLLQAMDSAIAGGGNDPSLSTSERLSSVNALGVERQNFVDRGMLPFSSRLRKASIAYVAEMRSAWAPWEAACNNLIDYYTKTGDVIKADEIAGQKMNALKVVAIWKAVGAKHKPWNETLLSNGMRIGAKGELWGYWRMEGNQIFFEEVDHKTFGVGTIADDGLSFKGRHGKYPLSGKLTIPSDPKAPTNSKVAFAGGSPTAIQTDANQPRVEALKDQAPKAIESVPPVLKPEVPAPAQAPVGQGVIQQGTSQTAQAQAVSKHPDLGKAGSAFNLEFVISRGYADEPDFQLMDEVVLTKEAQLSFKNQPYRMGKPGEVATVLQIQPAAKTVFLMVTRQDGTVIAVSVAQDAVRRAYRPRFSPAEATLLAAACGRYLLNGRVVNPPANRAEVTAANIASADPLIAKIAKLTAAEEEFLVAIAGVPAKSAETVREFGKGLRNIIAKDFWNALMGRQKNLEDAVEQSESLLRGIQGAQTEQWTLACLGVEIPTATARTVAELAEKKNMPPANGRVSVVVTSYIDPMGLWVRVENRGPHNLNQCTITARRLQDVAKVKAIDKDRQIAAGLMGLLGSSPEAIVANDMNTRLMMRLYSIESGGFAYVPTLPPKGVVSFPVSSLTGIEFTNRLECSIWCNEGATLNESASNLSAELKALQAKRYQEWSRSGFKIPASPTSNPGASFGNGSTLKSGTLTSGTLKSGTLQPSNGL